MGINAFTPSGNTVTFLADTTAPTAVQVVSSTLGGNQYRVINTSSTTLVHLGFGANAATANSNATIPGANSAASMPILPNTDEILTFTPNMYVTGITGSGNATIYITPGDGL